MCHVAPRARQFVVQRRARAGYAGFGGVKTLRLEAGESYSALAGFYRRYELIYVVADEREVLRVRTNFRPGA